MHYDLIIVGGGLVGKSIACALRHLPLQIALIDANAVDRPDPRLIALNYGSFCFLNALGAWPLFEAKSSTIKEVHVSHRGHFGTTRLNADNIQLPALGYVVRAADINQALDLLLKETKNFRELRPRRVKALAVQNELVTVTVSSSGELGETSLSAELILAADGSDSTIRKLMHFETEMLDYQQSALVTTSRLTRGHQDRAYERFLEDGALAMLPLKAEQEEDFLCATIWTASREKIVSLMALENQAFTQALQEQFGYRLGRLQNTSQRHSFPLQFIRVKNPVREKVILLGNAAHTIHPIAAQGLNLALYEIAHLRQILSEQDRQKLPLTHKLSEQWAKIQPRTNLLLSHYLTQLFSSEFWGLPFARQLGLVSFDLCPPLKKRFSRLLAMETVKWI